MLEFEAASRKLPAVLRLIKFAKCKECIAVLKVLLEQAVEGELRGLVVCYRPSDGRDRVLLTGVYRRSAEAAMLASLRMKRVTERQLDLFEKGANRE